MIPKASQRGEGQDLATHLQNAFDNEYVEIADLRGAVARDLHGAFAEWEVCAHAMTGCRNYLYSLSVNPDPSQGQLTRAQYLDYIDRAEAKLNLSGQPRAIVFHIKEGREHCHVVWSRIDAEHSKAVHQAFDHQKLMMVTRQFARDHGLLLPDGMTQDAGRERGKKRSLSLYEKHQQDATGLTKEERISQVTEAWRRSDNARAFVKALEDLGYVLATGKRPYVLVDLYGEMNALPKLIDDRTVRTKDLRAFLERDFPPESLPSVDEARALVAQHRQAIEDFKKAQGYADRVEGLKRSQAERRRPLEAEKAAMQARHAFETEQLSAHQHGERRACNRPSTPRPNVLISSVAAAVRPGSSLSWRASPGSTFSAARSTSIRISAGRNASSNTGGRSTKRRHGRGWICSVGTRRRASTSTAGCAASLRWTRANYSRSTPLCRESSGSGRGRAAAVIACRR